MNIRIGTCNYVSLSHIRRAYGSEYKTAIDEGRVIVGKPQLKEGESLNIDTEGRYFIEVQP